MYANVIARTRHRRSLGQIILCRGDYRGHCRSFSSVPGLYPPGIRSTVGAQTVSRPCPVSPGGTRSPWLRTTPRGSTYFKHWKAYCVPGFCQVLVESKPVGSCPRTQKNRALANECKCRQPGLVHLGLPSELSLAPRPSYLASPQSHSALPPQCRGSGCSQSPEEPHFRGLASVLCASLSPGKIPGL